MMKFLIEPSKLIYKVLTIAALTLSTKAMAFCSVTEVERQLSSRGISVEEVETDANTDYGALRLWKDGNATRLYVDTDGDLTFRTWYDESWSPNLRVANEINETFKFVSAHIDQDGDLEVSYYVPHFFSDCPEHVHQHTRFWWTMVTTVTSHLNKR